MPHPRYFACTVQEETVADKRCLPVHLSPGGNCAEEADDCVAVEEHEAARVIGPVMLEQPAPGGGPDARRAEGLLEEAADRLPIVRTQGTEMRARPTSRLRRYRLRAGRAAARPSIDGADSKAEKGRGRPTCPQSRAAGSPLPASPRRSQEDYRTS
jgi:hypothetical protein